MKNNVEQNKIPKEILNILENIFLDNTLEEIINSSSFEELEDWDSLNHIILVVEIEKKLSIRFNSGEISTFKNVGEMCDAILKKQESDEF